MPPTAPRSAPAPLRSLSIASVTSACLLLGAIAVGCVAGVDVTDEELAALEQGAGAGARGGSPGASGTGGTASLGGSPSSTLGGASSGNGGRVGTSGTGTGSAQGGTGASSPPAVGACAPVNGGMFDVEVIYTDRSNDSQISMKLVARVPTTSNGFPRSDLVLRYWFTDDGLGTFTPTFDYVNFGGGMDAKGMTTATFGNQLGSNYVDIGFTDPTDIGMGIAEVQLRMNAPNFVTVNLANDFSYAAGATDALNNNITAYVDGMKVSGCEPGGA